MIYNKQSSLCNVITIHNDWQNTSANKHDVISKKCMHLPSSHPLTFDEEHPREEEVKPF